MMTTAMMTEGQRFYSTTARSDPYTRADVLAGRVIRISPALITIMDGHAAADVPDVLRGDILARVNDLLRGGVRSLHVDVNFEDYSGYGEPAPPPSAHIFTPDFVMELAHIARAFTAFVTLHLLTDYPMRHLRDFEHVGLGAVCFQLDVVDDLPRLLTLVEFITALGACASPVIETVGTPRRPPMPPTALRALLEPALPHIGMVTLQTAGTTARSSQPAGQFQHQAATAILPVLRPDFTGTLQFQGGLTRASVGAAAALGADFLVTGTPIFHHPDGLTPLDAVIELLVAAADGLHI